MLKPELINELQIIAFSTAATASNRVAACRSLYANGQCQDRVRTTLDMIAQSVKTPDSVRIKAIDLIDKITTDTGNADQQAVDAESVRDTLMEQYTGCQTT